MKVPEDISYDGPKQKKRVTEYLDSLDWVAVVNADNKRFICPKCSQEEM